MVGGAASPDGGAVSAPQQAGPSCQVGPVALAIHPASDAGQEYQRLQPTGVEASAAVVVLSQLQPPTLELRRFVVGGDGDFLPRKTP